MAGKSVFFILISPFLGISLLDSFSSYLRIGANPGVMGSLKYDLQSPAWNDREVRARPRWPNELEIAGQSQPRCDVEVVKHFHLVLGSRTAADVEQVEVILQNLAQVGVRIGDPKLIVIPTLKEPVASDPGT